MTFLGYLNIVKYFEREKIQANRIFLKLKSWHLFVVCGGVGLCVCHSTGVFEEATPLLPSVLYVDPMGRILALGLGSKHHSSLNRLTSRLEKL